VNLPVNRRTRGDPATRAGSAALLAALLLGALPGCRIGSEAKRQEPGTVGFEVTGGRLDVRGLFARGRDENKPAGPNYWTQDFMARESVGVDTGGYVYHPNLAEYSADVTVGLVQQRYRSNFPEPNFEPEDTDGNLLMFDVELGLLKIKPYPGRLYARRYEALEPRPFSPTIRRTSEKFGGEWRYIDSTIPTRVQVDETTVDYDQIGTNELDYTQRDFIARLETGYNFTKNNFLEFLYEHRRTKQKNKLSPISFEFDVDDLRLGHRLRLGDQAQTRLDSNLNYYDQTGSFKVKWADWTEALNWLILDSLRAWVDTQLMQREQGSFNTPVTVEDTLMRISGGLEHRLFESLTSTVGGRLESKDFKDGPEIDRYNVYGGVRYRKETPVGVLEAAYRLGYQTTDNSGSDTVIPVFDEPHTFNDPLPIIIDGQNIVESSIVITDVTGTTLYTLGLDYTVLKLPAQVEIYRIPTGRINNGQTVLVDYVQEPVPAFQLDQVRQNLLVRHEFEFGLAPYYRLEYQDQTVDPSDLASPVPNDYNRHFLGLEYTDSKLSAKAEYQRSSGTFDTYDGWALSGSFNQRLGETGRLNLNGIWTRIDYTEPNKRLAENLYVGGQYRQELVKHLDLDMTVTYRALNDTVLGDSDGVDIKGLLELLYGKTTVRLGCDFSIFDTSRVNREWMMLYLQLTREF